METRALAIAAVLTINSSVLVPDSRAAVGGVDRSFRTGDGATGEVLGVASQGDGKVLVGGGFTSFNFTTHSNIVRLNTDGSVDNSFNPGTGPNSRVHSIVVQPDNKILIGGVFTKVNGTNRYGVARLNADGSLDSSFNTGSGAYQVNALALQPDGKLLIGGYFPGYNGSASRNIARINADGSRDPSFNVGTGIGSVGDETVLCILVQPDNKVLIGGDFRWVQGRSALYVCRFNADGSFDTGFDPDYTAGMVLSVALQPDGKILLGSNYPSNRVLRLHPDGSRDVGFVSNLDSALVSVVLQPDGKVLIGGFFTNVNGIARNRIARLNTDGTLDTNFNPGTGVGPDYSYVYAIARQADGKVLLVGPFTTVDGIGRRGVARLLGEPSLAIDQLGSNALLSWPTNAPGFILQSAPVLAPALTWTDSTEVPAIVGSRFVITNEISGRRFYRLRAP